MAKLHSLIEKVDGARLTEDATLDALRDMLRHHTWATLQLIEYCAGLTPEQLSESVPGTRGPILETLRHIVQADYGYKKRFRVHSEPAVKESDLATLELMRTVFAKEAEIWQSLLERLREFDITIPAEPWEDPPWPEAPHPDLHRPGVKRAGRAGPQLLGLLGVGASPSLTSEAMLKRMVKTGFQQPDLFWRPVDVIRT